MTRGKYMIPERFTNFRTTMDSNELQVTSIDDMRLAQRKMALSLRSQCIIGNTLKTYQITHCMPANPTRTLKLPLVAKHMLKHDCSIVAE